LAQIIKEAARKTDERKSRMKKENS
jgi:hypothetical protein